MEGAAPTSSGSKAQSAMRADMPTSDAEVYAGFDGVARDEPGRVPSDLCSVELPVDDRGDAHAVADAQGGRAVAQVSPLELAEQSAQDHRSGSSQRMAQRDRSSVHVDPVERNAELLAHDDR